MRFGRLAIGVLVALGLLTGIAFAQEVTEAIEGRLRFEGEPVEGVRVEATGQDFNGEAVTDAEGAWRIELPAPGDYEVTLDLGTLPEDVGLRDPERATLEVGVRPGQARTLLFALGEGATAATTVSRVPQAVVNGLKFGLIIAMTAIGLSLVYGTTRLVNFAHGELVTFGAVIALAVNTAGPRLHLVAAAVAAVATGGALGAALERGLWRPLRARRTGMIQLLVISIGLSLLLRHLILFWLGGSPHPYADYALQGPVRVAGVAITPRDLVVMAGSVVVLGLVGFMLVRTRVGKAVRAVADDVDLAESSGVDVQRIILVIWVLAGVLAALGGVFLGVVENVDWQMGFRALLLMFSAVILGGLGAPFGAMGGGLVVGLLTELSTLVSPTELKFMWALLGMVLVLLFRPQGLFGRRERVG